MITESRLGAFVGLGAFAALERDELFVVTPPLKHPRSRALVDSLPGYLGEIDIPREVVEAYRRLEQTLIAARHRRAYALRFSLDALPAAERRRAKLTGLPLVHRIEERRVLKGIAPADALATLVDRLKPDLVAGVFSYWANAIVFDALAVARERGVPSLLVNSNWDGICCVGGFPVWPDYLGVWGEQTIEHAADIHGFPRERAIKLGAAGFQQYFDIDPAGVPSPFPFRYVLFPGTHARWDERAPLARLNRLISERGLDLKIVYRPYPGRYTRDRSDYVDENELEHVIIDPDVRDQYLHDFGLGPAPPPAPPFPTLTYFPALLSNAEFVVCPMSTMVVESALLDRRVIVPTYDDGIHTQLPLTEVSRFEIFDRMDEVEHFRVVRSEDQLAAAFDELTRMPPPAPGAVRDDPVVRWWLHWDERTYAERLAAAVEEIVLGAPREPAAMLA